MTAKNIWNQDSLGKTLNSTDVVGPNCNSQFMILVLVFNSLFASPFSVQCLVLIFFLFFFFVGHSVLISKNQHTNNCHLKASSLMMWEGISQELMVYALILYSVCMCAKLLQLCLTLCDLKDGNPLGSSVHGISQAKILEWVTVASSRASSWSRDRTRVSRASCTGRWVLYP